MEFQHGQRTASLSPGISPDDLQRAALAQVASGLTRILNHILTLISMKIELASSSTQFRNSAEAAVLNQALSTARRTVGILQQPLSLFELESVLRLEFEPQLQEIPERPALSPREREVLRWIAKGKTHVEAAAILGISERTVEQHVRNAKQKLNAVSTIQAVVEAMIHREILP